MSNLLRRIRQGGPDSLRSWLIALGCSILYFFTIGSNRASGIFFKELVQEGNLTRETASWPFNLAGASILYAGPLTGYLMTVANMQMVAFAGVIIFLIGTIPCYFNTSIVFLSIFFGVIRGTGMTLSTAAIPGIINNLFDRHRATAAGLSISGMSLGASVLPLLIQHVLDNEGLNKTFLFFGLISLCALLGPVPMVKPLEDNSDKSIKMKKMKKKDSDCGGADNPGFTKEETDKPEEEEVRTSKVAPNQNGAVEKYTKLECFTFPDAIFEVSMPEERSPSNTANTPPVKQQPNSNARPGILKSFASLLQTRGFYLVTLTNIAVTTLGGIFGLTVVDYAVDKAIDRNLAVYLLTVNAGSEMVGTLVLGWVCDRNFISRVKFVSLTLCLAGSAAIVFIFMSEFSWMMVCSSVIGVGLGASFSVSNVLYTEYISRENMFYGVTLTRAIAGAFFLGRTPLIGYFRDQLSSYDYLFYFLSGLVYFAALCWILEEIYKGFTSKRKASTMITPI